MAKQDIFSLPDDSDSNIWNKLIMPILMVSFFDVPALASEMVNTVILNLNSPTNSSLDEILPSNFYVVGNVYSNNNFDLAANNKLIVLQSEELKDFLNLVNDS